MKLRSILIGAVIVSGCSSLAPDEKPAATTAAGDTTDTAVTYESLVDMIRTRNLTTIDAVLAQPEFTNSFRRSFTAVFRSRSIQHADPANPRIILYGGGCATLVLAFTCQGGDCTRAAGAGPVQGSLSTSSCFSGGRRRAASSSATLRSTSKAKFRRGHVLRREPGAVRRLPRADRSAAELRSVQPVAGDVWRQRRRRAARHPHRGREPHGAQSVPRDWTRATALLPKPLRARRGLPVHLR